MAPITFPGILVRGTCLDAYFTPKPAYLRGCPQMIDMPVCAPAPTQVPSQASVMKKIVCSSNNPVTCYGMKKRCRHDRRLAEENLQE